MGVRANDVPLCWWAALVASVRDPDHPRREPVKFREHPAGERPPPRRMLEMPVLTVPTNMAVSEQEPRDERALAAVERRRPTWTLPVTRESFVLAVTLGAPTASGELVASVALFLTAGSGGHWWISIITSSVPSSGRIASASGSPLLDG